MMLLLKDKVTKSSAGQLADRLSWMGLKAVVTEEDGRFMVAVVSGDDQHTDFEQFSQLPEVESILPFTHKFKLGSRQFKKEQTIIRIKDQEIGGKKLTVMAGPCAIENETQIHRIAEVVSKSGANILRGGAFKPRTSPYDFQGLGETGLQYMQSAAQENNMLSITEVMDPKDLDLVAEYIDILQIGARNMQNFSLLKQAGATGKPIFLKRGLSATYMDLLMAAEYVLQTGNPNVMLCERGIRTFETYARNTLDIAAVPILRELTHLPIIIDPSHGTGIREAVPPMAYAAVAAGADGIMVEVHTEPDKSFSDAKQTIHPDTFKEMMAKMKVIAGVVDRDMP